MYRYFVFVIFIVTVNAEKFRVIREWKYINFTWNNENDYQEAVQRGSYIPENNIVSGVNYYADHYYLTLPRMKDGVPVTLARIPAGPTRDTAPALEPYPSWEMNREGDCIGFQNIQSVEIDPKGQIWIIDSGRTETLTNPSSRCPPKLIIFDIKKNTTTTAYTFPENVASLNSNFLYDIVVDDTDAGYAYITDNSAVDPGIIVFSVKDHHSWKIRHSQTMRADPTAITFKVNGVILNSPLNLASIALGPKIHTSTDRIIVDEDREVYYSPISSLHLYSVNTTVLRNEQNGMNNGEYQGNIKDYGLKGSQSAGMVMDRDGVLYYTLLGTNSIAKWDSHTSFTSNQKLIARDGRFLEWPNAITFDEYGNLTILVNKLNKFIYGRLELNQSNFRLISANVGSRGYLFNQGYDYNIEPNISKAVTVANEAPEPQVLPGGDTDPYLVPRPIPERAESSSTTTEIIPEPTDNTPGKPALEAEPTAEPQPKSEPEPTAEPEPNSHPATNAEPIPISEPDSHKDPEPKPEPEPTSEAMPKSESEAPTGVNISKKNITQEESNPNNTAAVKEEKSSASTVCRQNLIILETLIIGIGMLFIYK